MPRAAVGFSSHLGWAAAVAVAGTRSRVEVVDRRKVILEDPDVPESHEPWHKASEAKADPARSREIVRRGTRAIEACARREVAALLRDLEKLGHRVVGAGVLEAGSDRELRFESVLAAHAMQHAAEGRLMRESLARAAARKDLRVLRVPKKELTFLGTERTGMKPPALAEAVAALGEGIGPPWRADQKDAALIAWLALQ